MQLIPMAVGMGQQAAQNPNASIGGQGGLGLDKIDPIGKWIVGKGGDPYNLYGEKDNPGALFFPSSTGTGNLNTTLPNLGASTLMPRLPGGSFQAPQLTGGKFNQMAQSGAGPLFNPSAPGGKGSVAGGSGGKGAPGQAASLQIGRGNEPTMPIFPMSRAKTVGMSIPAGNSSDLMQLLQQRGFYQ